MKPLFVATESRFPNLYKHDAPLISLMAERHGVALKPFVWDQETNAPQKGDFVLIRSVWDYYTKIDAFRAFLDRMEQIGARLINPVDTVRENLDKRYLQGLGRDFTIIPTFFSTPEKPANIETLLKRYPERLVIKPAVSAGSYETYRLSAADLRREQEKYTALFAAKPMLIQAYMPAIETEGEWSTVVFENGYQYSVRKTPKAGDFRIQGKYGGTYAKMTPPMPAKVVVDALCRKFAGRFTYMRIDGVFSGGVFYLMEVELIEPDLYFNVVPEARETFADVLSERIHGSIKK